MSLGSHSCLVIQSAPEWLARLVFEADSKLVDSFYDPLERWIVRVPIDGRDHGDEGLMIMAVDLDRQWLSHAVINQVNDVLTAAVDGTM